MNEGGFSLRKWNSNSRSFGKRINKDEERKRRETMGISPNEKESLQNHENVYTLETTEKEKKLKLCLQKENCGGHR